MNLNYSINTGQPYPMGVTFSGSSINIAISFPIEKKCECGIILYDDNQRELKIPFPESMQIGALYCIQIKTQSFKAEQYIFYIDETLWMDPYARSVKGREKWGIIDKRKDLRAGLIADDFDEEWEADHPLHIPYEDSVIYSLHLRGFTKHVSSGVRSKGTFEGLTEKIPYLNELGITAIECMPVYEFDEIIMNPAYNQVKSELLEFMNKDQQTWEYHINYWGFSSEGNFYFAPKASYAAGNNTEMSFRYMIKELHKHKIEFIMQIYFPPAYTPGFILEVLRYWVMTYHVDGFHIMGTNLPMPLLSMDPVLRKTKLISECSVHDFENEAARHMTGDKNMAVYRDSFRIDSRKYLKGDEDMLSAFGAHIRHNDEREAVINHITDYRGFTLMDLVSYERKHNENNGEDNRDGSDYNYSWNCGVEGTSRKKAVWQLRLTQRKNALSMLLLAQGTPLLLAGDEFGRTIGGNNNAYCQDNVTNWVNWRIDKPGSELLDFTQKLISFRKQHPVLHKKKLLQLIDSISCGYPDISYHGQQAWYTGFENYNRHLGIMYCGLYAIKDDGNPDDFIYMAFNMHWIEHEFALPILPVDYYWEITYGTHEVCRSVEGGWQTLKQDDGQRLIKVKPRSIMILTGKKDESVTKKIKSAIPKKMEAESNL